MLMGGKKKKKNPIFLWPFSPAHSDGGLWTSSSRAAQEEVTAEAGRYLQGTAEGSRPEVCTETFACWSVLAFFYAQLLTWNQINPGSPSPSLSPFSLSFPQRGPRKNERCLREKPPDGRSRESGLSNQPHIPEHRATEARSRQVWGNDDFVRVAPGPWMHHLSTNSPFYLFFLSFRLW